MKVGIIISVVIVLVFGAALFFGTYGGVPSPTGTTAGDRLARQQLPADLKPVFNAGDPSRSANEAYYNAFAIYQLEMRKFGQDQPGPESSEAITNALIDAMNAGNVRKPFLDDKLSMITGAKTDFGDALERVPEIVVRYAKDLYDRGQKEKGIEACKAAFALGSRAFHHSVRVYNRYQGLQTMAFAQSLLYEWSTPGSAEATNLENYRAGMDRIIQIWDKKLMVVRSTKPHVGDLINMARNDKDLTWRVEATLWLGVARYTTGEPSSKRAINRQIQEYKRSTEPMIAQAAQAADTLTKDQLHMIR